MRSDNRRIPGETDFFDTEDQCLELGRDELVGLFLFRYSRKDHSHTVTRKIEIGDRSFRPPQEDELSRHVRLPGGCTFTPTSTENLLKHIEAFFESCLDLGPRYRYLLACFVVSTWLVDRLSVAPYLALVGLPRSGKSTALRALHALCRRSLLTSDISSAALYRVCDRLMPTLCIDEAATASQPRTLFHLLRSGTTRDSVALREKQAYRAYGAKVVVWSRMPADESLNSRCIVIPMQETSRMDLKKIADPEMVVAADKLSSQLLLFRWMNYRSLSLQRIPGDESLRSRDRDLYEALALPIGLDGKACSHLLECLEYQKDLSREPLPAGELAVLEGFFKKIHVEPNDRAHTLRDLKDEANQRLVDSHERFRVDERFVSNTLRTFGFLDRKRRSDGWVVLVDRAARQRTHELLSLYGINGASPCLDPEQPSEWCEFCKDPGSKQLGPVEETVVRSESKYLHGLKGEGMPLIPVPIPSELASISLPQETSPTNGGTPSAPTSNGGGSGEPIHTDNRGAAAGGNQKVSANDEESIGSNKWIESAEDEKPT